MAAVAVVPLSFLSGWRAGLVHIVAVALGLGYDLGLKATRASVVTYAGAFGLLPVFVALGQPAHQLPPAWTVIGAALLGAGAHLANALPDLAGDITTGVLGLPQRLGPDPARVLAALLLLAASLVLAFGGTSRAAVLAAAVVVAVGLAGAVLASRAQPRWAFRAAMALAGADVILLVVSGGSL